MSQPRIGGISHVDLSVTDLAASTAWYQELLGMVEWFGHRNNERGYEVKYLMEPDSGVVMGFEQQDVLVFRDPDDVQLELIFIKPAASSLVEG